MTRKRTTLERWITEALADSEKEGEISQMVLVHMVGQNQKEVHTTKFSPGKKWTPKDLANMFMGKAETYAQDMVGVQTFHLQAFYGGRQQHEAALPFTVIGTLEHGGATEPPTQEGRIQQHMRQSEMLFLQTYRRQEQLDNISVTMIRELGAQNVALSTENRDMFSLMKDMMVQLADRHHETRMKELEFSRSTEERKQFMKFLPPLANTILGREVFPQGMEDSALIEGFMDSLTADDVEKLAAVIKPEMLGPLMSRLERHNAKRDMERASQQASSAVVKSSTPRSEGLED